MTPAEMAMVSKGCPSCSRILEAGQSLCGVCARRVASIHASRKSDADELFVQLLRVRGAVKRKKVLKNYLKTAQKNDKSVDEKKKEMRKALVNLRSKNWRLSKKVEGFKAKKDTIMFATKH